MRLLCYLLIVAFAATGFADKKTKVLYFTHQPGRWHKYTPQLKIFKEFSTKAGWEVTVMTGNHNDQVAKLRTSDFAKGFDAVIYNFCFAHSSDIEGMNNLIKQTEVNGVPALLIHCAMHSFWSTYRSGKVGAIGPEYKGKAKAKPALVKEWKEKFPNEAFRAWGDFTGVASTGHGPKKPIEVTKVNIHPATKRLPADFKTGNTELYNNAYLTKGVIPILKGKQGKSEAIIMWTVPRGKSQVMGLTLGPAAEDWQQIPFQYLVIDGINFMVKEQRAK
ncbi:MAG: hypothetical protein HRT88_04145 [Lentisphaeraceae bacterium]|nr:hypothetical protein [Lentisphaeraceae bacterium]